MMFRMIALLLVLGGLLGLGCSEDLATSDTDAMVPMDGMVSMDGSHVDTLGAECVSGTECRAPLTCQSPGTFHHCPGGSMTCEYSGLDSCDTEDVCMEDQVCAGRFDGCCTRSRCVPRCPDTPCGEGTACDDASHACVPNCVAPTPVECPVGFTCDPTSFEAGPTGCAPAPCASDAACGADRICVVGTCRPKPGRCGYAPDAG